MNSLNSICSVVNRNYNSVTLTNYDISLSKYDIYLPLTYSPTITNLGTGGGSHVYKNWYNYHGYPRGYAVL